MSTLDLFLIICGAIILSPFIAFVLFFLIVAVGGIIVSLIALVGHVIEEVIW